MAIGSAVPVLERPVPGSRARLGSATRPDRVAAALLEAEAALRAQRPAEALGRASRALRRAGDPERAAALRRVRAQALWSLGRRRPGRREAERALACASQPATRAAAAEALAHMARDAAEMDAAGRHASEAEALYAAAADAAGLVRARGVRAARLRDLARSEEALVEQEQRLRLAEEADRPELVACVLADRGDLLGSLGRWRESRADLSRAARLFREAADPREALVTGLHLAVLDVAAGDLHGARARLARAREALGHDAPPGSLAEIDLVSSDVRLAAGDGTAAAAEAEEALKRFGLLRDRVGECRSRVRLCHALLSLGRAADAVREARRALKAAPPFRRDLRALAWLSLGRALLRTRGADAGAAFDAGLAEWERPSGVLHALRLGRLLAQGASRDDEAVRLCLVGLEMWGDRRLSAVCQADVRERHGAPEAASGVARPPSALPPSDAPLVDAALALAGDGEWGLRFTAALAAVRRVVPWWRAALVAEPGVMACGEPPQLEALHARDVARELAVQATDPMVVDLSRSVWRGHPTRVLYDLGCAAIVPVSEGRSLYLDRRAGERGFAVAELALLVQLSRLLARHWPVVEEAAAAPPPRFTGIVGRSPALASALEQLARFAASDVSVHVHGETGTGKEKIAHAVHLHSPRRERPFVAVNASSLSDELFESEMWGHARGAFTGAHEERRGLVAEADGGTLFIDEVADLTPRSQARLLRFLATGEYRRVGDPRPRRANVRIVSAANVPLAELAAAGRFRLDLMFRLIEASVSLPPLRERGDDVLLLARHFLAEEAARCGRPAPRLSSELAGLLRAYAWPGNVRELHSEMRRLLFLSAGGPLQAAQLSARVVGGAARPARSLREAVADFEREHLRRVLAENGDSRTRSALALGLTRQALLLKMRRLGL